MASPALAPLLLLLLVVAVGRAAARSERLHVRVLDGARQARTLHFELSPDNHTAVVTWEQADGPIFSSLLHTAEHVQAHFALLLPEQDRGETRTQRLCLLSHARVDAIPVASMMDLRQGAGVASADEDRGQEVLPSARPLRPAAVSRLPGPVRHFCAGADALLMPEEDARALLGGAEEVFAPGPAPPLPCHLAPCLLWFPCAVATCEAAQGACGVKACRQCFRFEMEASSARCP